MDEGQVEDEDVDLVHRVNGDGRPPAGRAAADAALDGPLAEMEAGAACGRGHSAARRQERPAVGVGRARARRPVHRVNAHHARQAGERAGQAAQVVGRRRLGAGEGCAAGAERGHRGAPPVPHEAVRRARRLGQAARAPRHKVRPDREAEVLGGHARPADRAFHGRQEEGGHAQQHDLRRHRVQGRDQAGLPATQQEAAGMVDDLGGKGGGGGGG